MLIVSKESTGEMSQDRSAALDPVPMTGNLPPRVAEVFDAEYRRATTTILADRSPMDWIGVHQFLGMPDDRQAGAVFASKRLASTPRVDRVVVSHSTQALLTVLLGSLVGTGETLVVEELTYPAIGKFAAQMGIKLVSVKLDNEGILPDSFARVCESANPKALYTTPTLQNPTTAVMSLERRREIVQIARKYNVCIIEDDIYALLPTQVPAALADLAPELTYYMIGTAKSVAAGLKVAYLVLPEGANASQLFWPGSGMTYWMVAPSNAAIASELIRSEGIDRIIAATRVETVARQRQVADTLKNASFRTSPECLHVWLEVPQSSGLPAFVEDCRRRGADVGPSTTFMLVKGDAPHRIRFGTGKAITRADLQRGLDAIAGALVGATG